MDFQAKTFCPACGRAAGPTDNFCPHCGQEFNRQPLPVSFYGQVIAYAVSLLLPPFGLWYVFKYLRRGNSQAKRVAVIAAILTAISVIYAVYLFISIMNSVSQSIKELNGLGL